MILQQLYKDAGTILGENLPPPMYDTKPVRWVIQLAADGQFLNFQPLGGTKENKRGLPRLVPYPGPRSGNVIRPALLADTPAFVLGVAPDDSRAAIKHTAFKALIHRCAEETGNPQIKAVDTFLSTWDLATQTILPPELTTMDLVTFQVDDEWPADAEDVRAFWARVARPAQESADGFLTQCLVTGLLGPTEKSLPGSLKRIPGGQSSGVALVSANETAYESYGLERAQTSPISSEAAERFTKALNQLIAGDQTHITIGSLVYVFWTNNGADDEVVDFINHAQPEQVKNLLDSYRTGERKHTHLDTEPFYAVALSASGARAVVRDWITTTAGEVRERLAQWFRRQQIVDAYGEPGKPLTVRRLAVSLYRTKNNKPDFAAIEPRLLFLLMRAALHGDPLPDDLLYRAVARNRADRNVTYERAVLMTVVMASAKKALSLEKESSIHMTPSDTGRHKQAYLYGQLLAELEVVQKEAARPRKINAPLTDRYFGAASTSPATVFGLLLADANKAHLPKIRKNRPFVYEALQKRLEEILVPLPAATGFLPTLTLKEQALFSLGYYHQRAKDRKEAQQARERKQSGQATLAEVALAETLEDADDADTLTQED